MLEQRGNPFNGKVRTPGELDGKLFTNISTRDTASTARKHTSKKPNSYGVSGGPMIRALTCRTSMSRQATASAIGIVSGNRDER